jgi:hypothetical protein
VDNWRAVYAALEREGGLTFVDGAPALAAFWRRALAGERALCSQAEHARLYAQGQTGAVDAAAARLLALIP